MTRVYNQDPIAPEILPKAAVITSSGLEVMSFELSNPTQTFQRYTEIVLHRL